MLKQNYKGLNSSFYLLYDIFSPCIMFSSVFLIFCQLESFCFALIVMPVNKKESVGAGDSLVFGDSVDSTSVILVIIISGSYCYLRLEI